MTVAWSLVLALAASAVGPTVRVDPDPAFLEAWPHTFELSCDFALENPGAEAWRLVEIRLVVRDESGRARARRFLNGSGMNPGLHTIPRREIEPGGFVLVPNPFHTFDRDLLPAQLEYTFVFQAVAEEARETRVLASFAPRSYPSKAELIVPLKGRVLVFDGHDFYSHHRRWDVSQPFVRSFGWKHNAGRYAYDLTLVDEQGEMHRGDGRRKEDWYAFGAKLFAPADGVVVEVRADAPDHEMGVDVVDVEEVKRNPKSLRGNYLLIDHGQGEYSLLAHMKQGSAKLKAGDRVARGQALGQVGLSGDAYMVHVHYELVAGTDFDVEGLPSVFKGLDRPLDTGEILEVR
jgi:murein DD-endopeptidase MepM/ murein hydrolase activator NlpD